MQAQPGKEHLPIILQIDNDEFSELETEHKHGYIRTNTSLLYTMQKSELLV